MYRCADGNSKRPEVISVLGRHCRFVAAQLRSKRFPMSPNSKVSANSNASAVSSFSSSYRTRLGGALDGERAVEPEGARQVARLGVRVAHHQVQARRLQVVAEERPGETPSLGARALCVSSDGFSCATSTEKLPSFEKCLFAASVAKLSTVSTRSSAPAACAPRPAGSGSVCPATVCTLHCAHSTVKPEHCDVAETDLAAVRELYAAQLQTLFNSDMSLVRFLFS